MNVRMMPRSDIQGRSVPMNDDDHCRVTLRMVREYRVSSLRAGEGGRGGVGVGGGMGKGRGQGNGGGQGG